MTLVDRVRGMLRLATPDAPVHATDIEAPYLVAARTLQYLYQRREARRVERGGYMIWEGPNDGVF